KRHRARGILRRHRSGKFLSVNSLPDGVSSGSAGFEVVLVIGRGTQLLNLEFFGGVPDFKGLGD
ncbi:MAG: hypothetical protein WED15_09995, partial [Akkermansiaceae bacterium]